MTKTLDDVKADMSALFEELKKGEVEVKIAAELANITGKFLKAEQLIVMHRHLDQSSAKIALPKALTMEEFRQIEVEPE